MRGVIIFAKAKIIPAGRRLEKSKASFRFLLVSYRVRTLRVLAPLNIRQKLNKEPLALSLISGG